MEAPLLFFELNATVLGLTLAMPDCQLPTQEDVDRFIYEYGEIDIIFHNPTTNALYRFESGEPDGKRVYDPLAVLHDNTPMLITWDFPVNRPKQPILDFLDNRD